MIYKFSPFVQEALLAFGRYFAERITKIFSVFEFLFKMNVYNNGIFSNRGIHMHSTLVIEIRVYSIPVLHQLYTVLKSSEIFTVHFLKAQNSVKYVNSLKFHRSVAQIFLI